MKKLAAYLITFYQKRISPHKGFSCAHRCLHKGDSCSEFTKKQILESGLFSSVRSIRTRLNQCREAAEVISQRPPLAQRGDCDLGLSSCDVGSCGDLGGADVGGGSGGGSSSSSRCSYVDCGNCASCDFPTSKNKKFEIALIIIILLIILGLAYYFIGRQVDSVKIRLKDNIEETVDSGVLDLVFKSQKPDYAIRFKLKNGSAETKTLNDQSAKDWINLEVNRSSFYIGDISKMTIVNKGILTQSKALDSILNPPKNGEGKIFEYSIKRKWDLF